MIARRLTGDTFLLDIIAWRDAITGDAEAGTHKARVIDDIG